MPRRATRLHETLGRILHARLSSPAWRVLAVLIWTLDALARVGKAAASMLASNWVGYVAVLVAGFLAPEQSLGMAADLVAAFGVGFLLLLLVVFSNDGTGRDRVLRSVLAIGLAAATPWVVRQLFGSMAPLVLYVLGVSSLLGYAVADWAHWGKLKLWRIREDW